MVRFYFLLVSSFFTFQYVCGQSSLIYFKASNAYFTIGKSIELQGPIQCDDIVLINRDQQEITFLSKSAEVFKIVNTEVIENNKDVIKIRYIAVNKKEKRIMLTFNKLIQSISILYMNMDGTGMTQLKGVLREVY